MALDRILIGQDVRPGDAVVGIASSGVHSNGFTLARTILQRAGLRYADRVAELGTTLGEALLEPTCIYVKEAVAMLDAGLAVKAFIHITGDGFLNLTRVEAAVGFVIDRLLPVPPIFALIQRHGDVPDTEMFRVYNMGVGFCVVVDPRHADRVIELAARRGRKRRWSAVPSPTRRAGCGFRSAAWSAPATRSTPTRRRRPRCVRADRR